MELPVIDPNPGERIIYLFSQQVNAENLEHTGGLK